VPTKQAAMLAVVQRAAVYKARVFGYDLPVGLLLHRLSWTNLYGWLCIQSSHISLVDLVEKNGGEGRWTFN